MIQLIISTDIFLSNRHIWVLIKLILNLLFNTDNLAYTPKLPLQQIFCLSLFTGIFSQSLMGSFFSWCLSHFIFYFHIPSWLIWSTDTTSVAFNRQMCIWLQSVSASKIILFNCYDIYIYIWYILLTYFMAFTYCLYFFNLHFIVSIMLLYPQFIKMNPLLRCNL